MNSQSSMSCATGNVEMNSAGGANSSRRDDPRLIPQEMPPHELGRPSLSESTVGHSKNFSPQFDRMSSHTKDAAKAGRGAANEDLLDDDEQHCQPQAACQGFMS